MSQPRPTARKSLGQHFLHDEAVLNRIAALARPLPGSGLVEVGPGTGNLTAFLRGHGGPLVAIERDRRMVAVLAERFDGELELIEDDAARVNWGLLLGRADMGPAPTVVGNLPYNAASAILFALLESPVRPRRIVVMLQREVAQRLAAVEGTSAYGQLTVKVQMIADVQMRFRVGRGAFSPMPKVESAVVTLAPLAAPRHPLPDLGRFHRLLVAGFGQRRKTLARALHNGLALPMDEVREALIGLGLDERARAEALSVHRWADLAVALDPLMLERAGQPPRRRERRQGHELSWEDA